MQADLYIKRHGDNAGAAWLRNHSNDIKVGGVGYKFGIKFNDSKVRNNAKDATAAYLRKKHGKGSR